jgi:hypothetical protein
MHVFCATDLRKPMHYLDYDPSDLMVQVSELLVATSDASDADIDQSVPEVLRLLRDKMKMDVVFVSEFVDGLRVMRHVDTAPGKEVVAQGQSDALERSWCQRVVDGRLPGHIPDARALPASAELLKELPFSIGTHISVPIVLANGEVYGTLCTFSLARKEDGSGKDDHKVLRYSADMVARRIEQHRKAGSPAAALMGAPSPVVPQPAPPKPAATELSLEPMERKKRF